MSTTMAIREDAYPDEFWHAEVLNQQSLYPSPPWAIGDANAGPPRKITNLNQASLLPHYPTFIPGTPPVSPECEYATPPSTGLSASGLGPSTGLALEPTSLFDLEFACPDGAEFDELNRLCATVPEILNVDNPQPIHSIEEILQDLHTDSLNLGSIDDIDCFQPFGDTEPAPAMSPPPMQFESPPPVPFILKDTMWGAGCYDYPRKRSFSENSFENIPMIETKKLRYSPDRESSSPPSSSFSGAVQFRDSDNEDLGVEDKILSMVNHGRSVALFTNYAEHNYSKICTKPQVIHLDSTNEDIDVETCVETKNPVILNIKRKSFVATGPRKLKNIKECNSKSLLNSTNVSYKATKSQCFSDNVKKQLQKTIANKMQIKETNRMARPSGRPTTAAQIFNSIMADDCSDNSVKVSQRLHSTQGKPAAYAKRMQKLHAGVTEDEEHDDSVKKQRKRGKRRKLARDPDDDADKRSIHNRMERLRRVDLRNLFNALRDSIPTLRGKPRASKVIILKTAYDLCANFINNILERRALKSKHIELSRKCSLWSSAKKYRRPQQLQHKQRHFVAPY